MGSEPERGLLGRLAIHFKLINMNQLAQATQQQSREPHRKLGDILVGNGIITEEQLQKLLAAQKQFLARTGRKRTERTSLTMQAVQHPPPQPAPPVDGNDPAAYDPSMRDLDSPTPSSAAEVMAARVAQADAVANPEAQGIDLEPTSLTAGEPAPRRSCESAGVPAAVAAPAPAPAPAAPRPQRPPPDPRAVEWLHGVMRQAAQAGASDIHLHSEATIRLRRFTRLVEFTDRPLPAAQAEVVLTAVLDDAQYQRLDEHGEVDFAYTAPEIGRFRANVYRQHRGLNGVFHYVPSELPTLESLGLPTQLAKVTNFHQGLVLISGPAGCGKSTTLAALVNIINEERSDHILTIEDPIEYIHPAKRCLVNQRQVLGHTESFARALRAALREDPDVICIGELRDLETISLALSAAETGHLVLGKLHTNNAIRTINRLIGVYPPGQQPQVRTMLSESLRSIISQRLLPRVDGEGVALALEVLHVNKAVGNLIRENKTFQLHSIMQTGVAHGMRLLDLSLTELVSQGLISKEEAAANSEKPQQFK